MERSAEHDPFDKIPPQMEEAKEELKRSLRRTLQRRLSQTSNGIFISYRRGDTVAAVTAARLYDELNGEFGVGKVVKDVHTMAAVADSAEILESFVMKCEVQLAVIGQGWLTERFSDDYVRLEIESAIRHNVQVIPILVERAEMPRASDLPSSLRSLTSRRAMRLRNSQFNDDVRQIIAKLHILVSESSPRVAEPSAPKPATAGRSRNFGIFISYRRSDEAGLAGRLYDKLVGKFGEGHVFMDVSSIDLGVDFVEVLEQTLAQCRVLIVVIGRDWLWARDEGGNRRLDDTHDLVRLEIETALKRNVRVIPILVDDTRMPRAAELPDPIKPLARRNGRDISNAHFNSDCTDLISTLERILGADRPA